MPVQAAHAVQSNCDRIKPRCAWPEQAERSESILKNGERYGLE